MKIFHVQNTRAVRIIWLFEELQLPYELEVLKFGSPEMRSAEYRKVHPMGRVPVLIDGKLKVFESGAIVQYVLAKYGDGKLLPDPSSENFSTYLQWLHYAEGMIMPPVNTLVVETRILSEERRNQVNIDRAMKLLTNMLVSVDDHLRDKEYLAGEFSGADIMTGHACIVSSHLGAEVSDKPNLLSYIERLKSRPALQKAFPEINENNF